MFFRDCVNSLIQRKHRSYCYKTLWIAVHESTPFCHQCRRITRFLLTIDGVRQKLNGKTVCKNREQESINRYYRFMPPRARRHLNFNE